MLLNFLFFLSFISQRSYGIAIPQTFNDTAISISQEIENLPLDGIKSSIKHFLNSLDALFNKLDALSFKINDSRLNFSHISPTEKPPCLKCSPRIYNHHKYQLKMDTKFLMIFYELEWLNQKKKDMGIIKYLDTELYDSLNEEMRAYEGLLNTVHGEKRILSHNIMTNAEIIENYIKRIRKLPKNKDLSIEEFNKKYPILTGKIKLLNQILTELKMLLKNPYSTDNQIHKALIQKSIHIRYYSDLREHLIEILQFDNIIDHQT